MFSSILSLAVAGISITEEDKFQPTTDQYILSKQFLPAVAKHQLNDSLLSVLDDKNKIIANLRKQLQNQKMQLTYYIQKDMNKSKITELSQSCMPQASEDSLPLNLAINKFCKQSGIKTKLLLLHERMSQLEYKIGNALKDQEFILRKIVNKLCEFVKTHQAKSKDFKEQFKSFISDPAGVSLFDKLLTATIALGNKLDSFKICCDRVLIIEEERNAIVEQVYSIPIEERINRTCLAEVQIEKLHLEHELKRIFEQQSADKHRIQELSLIEKILNNLQWELNSTYLKNEESCISKLLKKINSEARVLLEMTKEQKRKFECELSKTNAPEPNRILLFINIAGGNNLLTEDDYDRWGIKTDEEKKFFEMVKTEVDLIKSKLKREAQKEMEESKIEVETFREKLTKAILDQTSTRNANKSLREELDELKREQKTAIMRLKTERDAYKSQVEDLQAIREAYAQLVEKQPNVSHVERKLWQEVDIKEQKLKELEKIVASQSEELSYMKSKLLEQKEQIIFLNRYNNLTKSNLPKLVPTECSNNHNTQVLLNLESSCSNIHCCNNSNLAEDRKFKQSKLPMSRCKTTSKSCSPLQIQTPEGRRPINNLSRFSCPDILPLSCQNIVKSTSIASQGNINEKNSSILTVEIKYESNQVSNRPNLFHLEESELFRNASEESVVGN